MYYGTMWRLFNWTLQWITVNFWILSKVKVVEFKMTKRRDAWNILTISLNITSSGHIIRNSYGMRIEFSTMSIHEINNDEGVNNAGREILIFNIIMIIIISPNKDIKPSNTEIWVRWYLLSKLETWFTHDLRHTKHKQLIRKDFFH